MDLSKGYFVFLVIKVLVIWGNLMVVFFLEFFILGNNKLCLVRFFVLYIVRVIIVLMGFFVIIRYICVFYLFLCVVKLYFFC